MNGLLQGYKVNFEFMADQIGSMNDDIDSRKTTDLTIVLSGLKKFTNYSIQVLAFTRVGDGVVSKALYCQTEEDGKRCLFDTLYLLFSIKCLFARIHNRKLRFMVNGNKLI